MIWFWLAQDTAGPSSAAEWVLRTVTAFGGSTALVLVLRFRADKKKVRADTVSADAAAMAALSGAAVQLIEPLHAELAKLRLELRTCQAEVAALRASRHRPESP